MVRASTLPAAVPDYLPPKEWTLTLARFSLTPRQLEIVQLILQARQQKEIATMMGLSPHTIRAYLRQVYARFAVTNSIELVLVLVAARVEGENRE